MCLGTLSVLYSVNLLFFKVMFLLKSMALIVEIPNSWVYELPTEKCFVTFFSGEHPNFWTCIFRQKGYYKTAHVSRSEVKYIKRPIISFS